MNIIIIDNSEADEMKKYCIILEKYCIIVTRTKYCINQHFVLVTMMFVKEMTVLFL